jgi:hypothetical protein
VFGAPDGKLEADAGRVEDMRGKYTELTDEKEVIRTCA